MTCVNYNFCGVFAAAGLISSSSSDNDIILVFSGHSIAAS